MRRQCAFVLVLAVACLSAPKVGSGQDKQEPERFVEIPFEVQPVGQNTLAWAATVFSMPPPGFQQAP